MANDDPFTGLFDKEYEVLRSAGAYVAAQLPRDGAEKARYAEEVRGRFAAFVEEYRRLLELTEKTFRISDVQGKALKDRDEEIRILLDNSKQGFLSFGRDCIVRRSHSRECERLLGRGIAGKNIVELLSKGSPERRDHLAGLLGRVFEAADQKAAQAILDELPNVLRLGDRDVAISRNALLPDRESGKASLVMLVLTEIVESDCADTSVAYYGYHDKLTSLYNRAYVEGILPQIVSRSNGQLSLVMADLNGLKLTNDAFGHECGDRVIASAARVFLECCRKEDIVARWGGDEFLLILPSLAKEGCDRVVRRIKATSARLPEDPVRLSFALGSASAEGENIDIQALMETAESVMYRNKLAESKKTRRRIVEDLGASLPSRCFVSEGHGERVCQMSLAIAEAKNRAMTRDEKADLRLLARLHDIGKASIPSSLLGKRGALDPEELVIVRGYIEAGYRMARSVEEPGLAEGILALRENWDGSGYPNGLRGEDIPLSSRIVAIADAYDSMTHDKPYRAAVEAAQARREIEAGLGSTYDPELGRYFLDAVESRAGH
jgi:diguanylate cyclase (GGDEF)-like protein